LPCPQDKHSWEEAENCYVDQVIIEPTAFCDLKIIKLRYSKKPNNYAIACWSYQTNQSELKVGVWMDNHL